MNWLDIVIILVLVLAAWQGWKQGVIVQVIGIVAIIAGVILARNYGTSVAGFVAIMLGVILVIVLVGRLTRGLFRIVGLGIFDNILGAVFSALKVWIIIFLILNLFDIDSIFNNTLWIKDLWPR